ncbi:hypothetical protein GW891_04315 [bacterium]|nr:hypothetical protein [bacterium]
MSAVLSDINANVSNRSLANIYATSISKVTFFYSISLKSFNNKTFEEINNLFMTKRCLRFVDYDFLRKNGELIFNHKTGIIITGSDSSRNILEKLFGVRMKIMRKK